MGYNGENFDSNLNKRIKKMNVRKKEPSPELYYEPVVYIYLNIY